MDKSHLDLPLRSATEQPTDLLFWAASRAARMPPRLSDRRWLSRSAARAIASKATLETATANRDVRQVYSYSSPTWLVEKLIGSASV
jgi:hypothetical protein